MKKATLCFPFLLVYAASSMLLAQQVSVNYNHNTNFHSTIGEPPNQLFGHAISQIFLRRLGRLVAFEVRIEPLEE